MQLCGLGLHRAGDLSSCAVVVCMVWSAGVRVGRSVVRPVMGNLHGVALGTWAAATSQGMLLAMANLSPSLLSCVFVCGGCV
jgi:hypothetical protein